ncbi:hypothetical protein [Hydrogenimonas sp.]
MPEKITDISGASTAIAAAFGMWGAFVNFLTRKRSGVRAGRLFGMFVADSIINAGLSITIFLGCMGYGLNELLSVSIASLLGHQGTRAFYLAELIIIEKSGATKTFDIVTKEGKK